VTSESPTPQPQHWSVARYLRLMGADLACARCGERYWSAMGAGYAIGSSPVMCPRCQSELTSPASARRSECDPREERHCATCDDAGGDSMKPWADTFGRTLLGAALLAALVLELAWVLR